MRHSVLETKWRRIARIVVLVLIWIAMSLFTIWAFAALYFDVRQGWLRIPTMVIFAMSLLACRLLMNGPWLRLAAYTCCGGIVLIWWLSLSPSNKPPWQEDAARPAWAEVHGDQIVMHNVRNCKYRT